MKGVITKLLSKHTKLSSNEVDGLLEVPPSSELGDFAFPCFILAKSYKKAPNIISQELAVKINNDLSKVKEISLVKAVGPYVNFFISKSLLAEKVIADILKSGDDYGRNDFDKGKKLLAEFSSPNIAKPFGIGHLRSTIIGNSLANIAEFRGAKVIRMNHPGDWGTQFGKLVFAYNKWGDDKRLKSDPIKYLLELYVKANSEEYEDEGRAAFKRLEEGGKEELKLWEKFKELSMKKFDELYDMLGVKFDVLSGESLYNTKMGEVLELLKKRKLLEESDGALIVNLDKYNLGVSLIQKSDGTSLYVTRDLAAAIDRYKKYKFDRMFYEVGQEQTLHFKQLFKILELLGFEWAKNCVHVYHGLYLGKDGKKFSTRKGKLEFMEDIINDTIEIAKKELKARYDLGKKELELRALKIAMAAIIYGDLKNYRGNDMIFDIERFVSFDGNTGPYLLYSYARANSILKKYGKNVSSKFVIPDSLSDSEALLVKLLGDFPNSVNEAYDKLDPSIIANYSYLLAKQFNEFYHSSPVIGSDKVVEKFRLALVKSFMLVLKNSLNLLGIDTIDEM